MRLEKLETREEGNPRAEQRPAGLAAGPNDKVRIQAGSEYWTVFDDGVVVRRLTVVQSQRPVV